MTARAPSPPRAHAAPSHDIIVGGARVTLGLPGEPPPMVLTWHDHGVRFTPGEGFNKRRKQRINLAVWHWTGGEGEPLQVADTLKKRGYGVEFSIATTGTVYQFADPLEVDTADAGGVNARSVGTEIVSYGMRGDAMGGWLMPRAGATRLTTSTLIHGNRVVVAAFHPLQVASARALADGLSRSLGIPRRVPVSADGAVYARALNTAELARFTGHVGHFHCTTQKCDPGPAFMVELQKLFAAVPPPLLRQEPA